MPVPHSSASPTPGPSFAGGKNLVGDALYHWCRQSQDVGYVFTQNELISTGIIPNGDVRILLTATQYLANRRLFKVHDVKGPEGIGWELIEEGAAASYAGLTSDEQMVYASIESAGTAGLWTKTIKAKSGVHAKVLDRVYKSLEGRHLIKPMKSVKNPGRKMYILSNLQPSEETTGGAWFNEGRLDIGMIEAVSRAIEMHCSFASWREVADTETTTNHATKKRKEPDGGFDSSGKGKAKKPDDEQPPEAPAPAPKPTKQPLYEPFDSGYDGYPTLHGISTELQRIKVTQMAIPNNALAQLLDVMVYDDRLYKMYRQARADESPDHPETNEIVMYRSFISPVELGHRQNQRQRLQRGSKTAMRQQELEDIGKGGFSEVPCMDCPKFDICGDGGPVNIKTCQYFDQWYKRMEEADAEADDPWPGSERSTKPVRR